MRNTLHHYFQPPEELLKQAWDTGVFSFDASVLLNIYGYSDDTRNKLVNLITRNANRVRLPYQYAFEYARRRSRVIARQVKQYLNAEENLRSLNNRVSQKTEHPYLSPASLEACEAVLKDLQNRRRTIESLMGADPYADAMLAVFDGKIGTLPTTETLAQLYQRGAERYASKVPPGYSDAKKPLPDCYGDYVGWCQLMDIARESKHHVIFVIDDVKEDWWEMEGERTVGPRSALCDEFFKETGHHVFMYSSENFLRTANERQAADIPTEVIREVAERLADQRLAERDPPDKQIDTNKLETSEKENAASDAVDSADAKRTAPPDAKSTRQPEKD
jgi:hypothetical protein